MPVERLFVSFVSFMAVTITISFVFLRSFLSSKRKKKWYWIIRCAVHPLINEDGLTWTWIGLRLDSVESHCIGVSIPLTIRPLTLTWLWCRCQCSRYVFLENMWIWSREKYVCIHWKRFSIIHFYAVTQSTLSTWIFPHKNARDSVFRLSGERHWTNMSAMKFDVQFRGYSVLFRHFTVAFPVLFCVIFVWQSFALTKC